MLSELIETLDAAGVGLDKMDWHEDRIRPAEYQHMAAFCFRMLSIIPKDQPGLEELLSTRTSLAEIWSAVQMTEDLQRQVPWTHGALDALHRARYPEQLGDDEKARQVIRLARKKRS